MQQNSPQFSMEEVMRIMNTDAGKKLMALLRSSQDPGLQKAMDQAAKGDYTQAKDALQKLTASAEVQALLRQLGGK